MTLDIGRILSHSFSIAWRHRWLWLLGVFGGAGFGFSNSFNTGNGSGNPDQVGRFLADHVGLILVAVAVLLVIVLVSAVIACVATPAVTWAGLQLDAGHDVGLGRAWREGRSRFWRYVRLVLLKALLSVAVVVAFGILLGIGGAVFSAGGTVTLVALVPLGILVVFLLVAALVVLSFGLLWSDRLLVILGTGAVDSVRAGWWMFRHNKLNTVIVSLVVGAINFGIGIAVALAAAVVAIPGIVMLVVYFSGAGGSSVLAILGFTWVIILGGGVFLVGSGFLGAVSQVAYALAARDLSISGGLAALPDVIGWDPRVPVAVPSGLVPAT